MGFVEIRCVLANSLCTVGLSGKWPSTCLGVFPPPLELGMWSNSVCQVLVFVVACLTRFFSVVKI